MLCVTVLCISVGVQAQDNTVVNREAPQSEVTLEQKAYFHYEKACRYMSRWKFPLAEVELDEAISDMPDLTEAHQRLCVLELFRLNLSRATAEFMVVTGLGEPLPYTMPEKLELNQKACKLHYEAGLEEANSHSWAGAIAEFQSALSYSPDNARVIRSEAFAYANVGELDKAETLYNSSFQLDPADAFAHADLAILLSQRGELKRAQGEMAKAVNLAPDAAALHVDLGWMAQARGDLPTASKEFDEAIKLSPNHPALWAHLGDLLQAQGQKQQALAAYNQALTLDASDQENVRSRIAKLKA
jgi:Flp pilus assembly protein TadD